MDDLLIGIEDWMDQVENGQDRLQNIVVPDKKSLTYHSYLKISQLLNLQELESPQKDHDEMLFIIIHQVYELWFKQILHEVEFARQNLDQMQLFPALKALQRVARIQNTLIQQVDILETMTPIEFNRFRSLLNPASGFQSAQFRKLEFRLGLRNPGFLKFFAHNPQVKEELLAALSETSLYESFLAYLKAQGFSLQSHYYFADENRPIQEEVLEVFCHIYQESHEHYELYLALEAMLDVDENLLLWRKRHVTMVERLIGSHQGTGGSSGVKYLESTLSRRAFPEIWQVRNRLH